MATILEDTWTQIVFEFKDDFVVFQNLERVD
jgi:hypothetical protein